MIAEHGHAFDEAAAEGTAAETTGGAIEDDSGADDSEDDEMPELMSTHDLLGDDVYPHEHGYRDAGAGAGAMMPELNSTDDVVVEGVRMSATDFKAFLRAMYVTVPLGLVKPPGSS